MGRWLNLLGMLGSFGLTLLATTVTSLDGTVPVSILSAACALGFGFRAIGCFWATWRRRWTMPWALRVLSWLCFGAAAALIGMAGSLFTVGAYAAFIVLDAAAGLVKRDVDDRESPQPKRKVDWRPILVGGAIVAYLAATAAFHLLVARYFIFGILVTWSILGLGFALLLRFAIVGQRAGEAWLYAPKDHRVHEMRERVVPDPQRAKAEKVLATFRARGDATPFIEFVREAARNADLSEADSRALEQRILASFARAGTRRDEDIVSALDEVESYLALKKVKAA